LKKIILFHILFFKARQTRNSLILESFASRNVSKELLENFGALWKALFDSIKKNSYLWQKDRQGHFSIRRTIRRKQGVASGVPAGTDRIDRRAGASRARNWENEEEREKERRRGSSAPSSAAEGIERASGMWTNRPPRWIPRGSAPSARITTAAIPRPSARFQPSVPFSPCVAI